MVSSNLGSQLLHLCVYPIYQSIFMKCIMKIYNKNFENDVNMLEDKQAKHRDKYSVLWLPE